MFGRQSPNSFCAVSEQISRTVLYGLQGIYRVLALLEAVPAPEIAGKKRITVVTQTPV